MAGPDIPSASGPSDADSATLSAWTRHDVSRPVLVVDDETSVRDMMARSLQLRGYRVLVAGDAGEALTRMQQDPPAVALCDIRMPGQDGLWLLAQIRNHFPDTAVVMVTAVHEVGPAVQSLRRGIVDYLTKPFTSDALGDAVKRAMEWHLTLSSERRWAEQLERETREREERLRKAMRVIAIDSDESVDTLLSVLTMQNRSAYAHARRVASWAVLLCDRIGRPDREKRTIRRAALLHDIGKSTLPPAVLEKPAPLTGEEYELVRTHPMRAHRLLSPIPFLLEAASLVRAVHERPDGCGFPDGIAGGHIPLGSRIIAIANAYDAMTTVRAYRDPVPPGEALSELERGAGTQFDATLVPLFVNLLRTH